jgi:hypothetical protein
MGPDSQSGDAPAPARPLPGWFSDRGRALVIPLAAMLAVVLLVACRWCGRSTARS